MKKLLVFMLVLGLTSLASAALTGVTISAGGQNEITLAPCETVVIDVYGPAGSGWLGAIYIVGDPSPVTNIGGEWGDTYQPVLPMNSGYYYAATGYPIKFPAAGDDAAHAIRYEYDDFGWGYELSAAAFSGEPAGGKEFDLLYHCSGPGDVTIEIADMGDWAVADSILIHQVPEPATIALLGLGGLFLRRRKK